MYIVCIYNFEYNLYKYLLDFKIFNKKYVIYKLEIIIRIVMYKFMINIFLNKILFNVSIYWFL